MKGLELAYARDRAMADGLAGMPCRLEGGGRSAVVVSPADEPLWAVRVDLDAGASLAWESDHGEEALFVLSGDLAVDDVPCPTRGAVVVEADAYPTVRATSDAAVVYLGHRPTGVAAGKRGRRVHVFGPDGDFRLHGGGHDVVMFVDATCDGCDLMLFTTSRADAHVQTPHSHSQDEIIYLLDGEITMGSYRFDAGDALAIEADRRYGFRSEDGYRFLNFRPALSWMTERDGTVRPEGGASNNLPPTGDRVDLDWGRPNRGRPNRGQPAGPTTL